MQKLEPASLLGMEGIESGATAMKHSLAFLQKDKQHYRMSNSTAGYVPKGTENRDSDIHLHANVHCSIIHNIQKTKIAQIHQMNG